jgi:hypothetical protein
MRAGILFIFVELRKNNHIFANIMRASDSTPPAGVSTMSSPIQEEKKWTHQPNHQAQ